MDRLAIDRLLLDYEPRHSDFQIENFIIGKSGDQWAQYKQCLREISARVQQIDAMEDEKKIINIKILIMKRRFNSWIARICGSLKKELRRQKYKSLIQKKENIEKGIIEISRELNCFVEKAVELKKEIGDLNESKRRELEARSWESKAGFMIGLDLTTIGAISRQTVELVYSLPIGMRVKLLTAFNQKLIRINQTP